MFGQRLERLLSGKGIQQSVLAEYLNMSDSTISQWKTGKRSPDIESLKRIAKYFNCTTDYLLGLSDHTRPESLKDTEEIELDFRIAASNEDGYGQAPSPELKRFVQDIIREELDRYRRK